MMKERPILMTPENAQKCHDGTKTQTRRLNGLGEINEDPGSWACTFLDSVQAFVFGLQPAVPRGHRQIQCPYGVAGDRLWVREAWAWPGEEAFLYKGIPADARLASEWQKDLNCCQLKWMPSIHMPRMACRTVLEITEVRVERLQEITHDDALAEGVVVRPDAEIAARVAGPPETGARMEYFALWESIHGVGSWEKNPWVWVISFKKVGGDIAGRVEVVE